MQTKENTETEREREKSKERRRNQTKTEDARQDEVGPGAAVAICLGTQWERGQRSQREVTFFSTSLPLPGLLTGAALARRTPHAPRAKLLILPQTQPEPEPEPMPLSMPMPRQKAGKERQGKQSKESGKRRQKQLPAAQTKAQAEKDVAGTKNKTCRTHSHEPVAPAPLGRAVRCLVLSIRMSLAAVSCSLGSLSLQCNKVLRQASPIVELFLSRSLSRSRLATFDSRRRRTSYQLPVTVAACPLALGVRLINEGSRFISKPSELKTTRAEATLPRCVPKRCPDDSQSRTNPS